MKFYHFSYDSLSIVKCWVVLVFLNYLYIFREKQIQAIEESFKASKLPPVHQTKPTLKPKRILPLLPYFDRYVLNCKFNLYCNEDLFVPFMVYCDICCRHHLCLDGYIFLISSLPSTFVRLKHFFL